MAPRAVVFDLDGTLAATEGLGNGQRKPADVLAPGRSADPGRWAVSQYVSDLPGRLIAQGYYVAIATRAPRAYASTLIELLGLDTLELLTSCGDAPSKGKKVSERLRKRRIEPSNAVYVGDETQDERVAEAAGTSFFSATGLASGELEEWLDDNRLERPLRPLARNFTGHPDDADRELIWMLRDGIPNPDLFFAHLDAERRHATPALEATLCMHTLLARPGVSARRDLQLALLNQLPEGAGPCIIRLLEGQGLFRVAPTLLTRAELRLDADLDDAYARALGRMYPPETRWVGGGPENDWLAVRYLRPYDSKKLFGDRLRKMKDYGGDFGTRFRSGPNTELNGLGLIADMMSAAARPGADVVVPIPSAPFSPAQPAEISYRLAGLVAQRLGLPYAELLERHGDDFAAVPDSQRRSVLLVDDQVTTGDSVRRAARALKRAGIDLASVVTYSSSATKENDAQQRCPLAAVNASWNLRCVCKRPA